MNALTLIATLLAATALYTQVAGDDIGFNSHVGDDGITAHELDLEAVVKCVEENGATADDLMAFVGQPTSSDSRGTGCAAGCFYQTTKIINDGGFNKKVFIETHSENVGLENATKAAGECEKTLAEVPKDLCSLGGAIYKCFKIIYGFAS